MKSFARSKIIFTFALLTCANLAQAGNMLFADHPLVGKIWDMNSRSYLDEAALLAMISTSDVLLLGETHDNPFHHEYQQKLLKARIASGARSGLAPALMMEQLNADDQPALDRALTGRDRNEALNSVNALVKFSNAQDYQPLLAIAVNNGLPVIAANVSSQILQPVIRRGYAAYDPGELKRLMVEEVWNDKRQNYLATHMGGAHCGRLRDEWRMGLSRSQRLRDALMADSAVAVIERGVVAIVGSIHARRDIGLPLYFAARDPKARIIAVAFVEVSPGVTDPRAYLADSATGEAPFDVVWFTPRAARADPCADFSQPENKQTEENHN
ncbi:MAG: ChaN family lipoprotein [Gallionella sp.]|nr:ChaN family lipoprotein [Gallionella sp.]